MKRANQLYLAGIRFLAKVGFAALLGASVSNIDASVVNVSTNKAILSPVVERSNDNAELVTNTVLMVAVETKYTPKGTKVPEMNTNPYAETGPINTETQVAEQIRARSRAPTMKQSCVKRSPRSDLISNTS